MKYAYVLVGLVSFILGVVFTLVSIRKRGKTRENFPF